MSFSTQTHVSSTELAGIAGSSTEENGLHHDDIQNEKSKEGKELNQATPDQPEIGPGSGQGQPLEFPEGGFRGWATVFGAFWVQFCGFGYTGSFGVYQDFYTQTYLASESSSAISTDTDKCIICLSWIGSVNAFLVIASGLVVGRLYDRGYFYSLAIGGALLYSFSLFMLSLAKPNQYYQIFLSQSLGAGIGAGMIYIPSIAVVSHYFQRRRSLVMTLVASGSSLGSILHPIMLNNTLNGPLGFGNSVRASAGLISGLLVVSCLTMRPRLPPPATRTNYLLAAKKFSHDSAFVLATLGMPLFTMGYYFPLFYIQLDSITHGLNQTFSFYSLVILNASSLVGRISSGFLADYFGVPNMVIVSMFGGAVSILGMIGLSSLASVVILGIIYGWFAGVYIALMAPLITVLTDDFSELGARMGIAFAITGLGGLIGQPIAGALLTNDYIWWRPALFCGIMSLSGCCLLIAMRIVLGRRKRAQSAPLKAKV
ncbi:hypothetical protein SERLADRAFT_347280 [Serpula lacrymans var. lacrymans S7.9]|uniref:Major facilitator superfamily (MFS) profile domain-containing protein n=1 Tax=Serpula lacrymans var. lacrymans (strain S7.9) TaxID=578457 RepID=F8NNI2_SERL9|nr:uncharacterized protein SERLADRAFT_347280 [Serpula lacrymans var. lacrymans S7.9]EGO28039.1 hypothetical protein SERLADRAFT_347280 [Serpula lacrymans var. lacrymans S7.9]